MVNGSSAVACLLKEATLNQPTQIMAGIGRVGTSQRTKTLMRYSVFYRSNDQRHLVDVLKEIESFAKLLTQLCNQFLGKKIDHAHPQYGLIKWFGRIRQLGRTPVAFIPAGHDLRHARASLIANTNITKHLMQTPVTTVGMSTVKSIL